MDKELANEEPSDNSPRRLGVFGGTFDPPHNAHVVLAASAIHQLRLDELLVLPAGVPWQKVASRTITSGELRLEMTRAAFADMERVTVSAMEVERSGDSYTVDTLEELSGPMVELFVLIGADVAPALDTWHRPERIAELAQLAVFPRPGYREAEPPANFRWTRLVLPALEISSTDLRNRCRNGQPLDGLTPRASLEVIERSQAYGVPET